MVPLHFYLLVKIQVEIIKITLGVKDCFDTPTDKLGIQKGRARKFNK